MTDGKTLKKDCVKGRTCLGGKEGKRMTGQKKEEEKVWKNIHIHEYNG